MVHKLYSSLNIYITSRPELRKIVANLGWLVTDSLIRLVGGLFIGAWVARYLGSELYGEFSLALAFVYLFNPVLRLGLDTIAVRDITRTPEHTHEIMGSVFVLRVAMAALALPLIALSVNLLYKGESALQSMVILVALGSAIQVFDVIDFWFQSQVRSKHLVYARNLAFVLASGAKVLCIALRFPVTAFAAIVVLESLIYTIGLVTVYFHNQQHVLAWRATMVRCRQLVKDSLPLLMIGITVAIYYRIDQVMMGQMLPGVAGKEAIGIYSVAARLSEFWYFLPVVIVNSVFPTIIRTQHDEPEIYQQRAQRLFNMMALMGYVVALGGLLFSGIVVQLLYGDAYQQAAPMLMVLMAAGVWICLGTARSPMAHAENLLIPYMISTILGALVNICINLVLIPKMGGLGAAIATFFAQCTAAYLSSLVLPAFRHLGRMQSAALIYPNPFRG